jgi:hypothetical protein
MKLSGRRFDRRGARGEIKRLTSEEYLARERAFTFSFAKDVLKQAPAVAEIAQEAKNGEWLELKKYAARLCARYVEIASSALKEVSDATKIEELLPVCERIIAFHASLMRIGALIRSQQLKSAMNEVILRPFRTTRDEGLFAKPAASSS